MDYCVYFLQSDKSTRYYCGQCNDVAKRLKRHNAGEMRSTKAERPWHLIGYVPCENRSQAVQLERKIKGRGIKRWLDEHTQLVVQPR